MRKYIDLESFFRASVVRFCRTNRIIYISRAYRKHFSSECTVVTVLSQRTMQETRGVYQTRVLGVLASFRPLYAPIAVFHVHAELTLDLCPCEENLTVAILFSVSAFDLAEAYYPVLRKRRGEWKWFSFFHRCTRVKCENYDIATGGSPLSVDRAKRLRGSR